MSKSRLTTLFLESVPLPEKGQRDVWDTTLPTFGVRVSQGGSKTFILKRHNSRLTIGRYPVISLSEARTEAKRMLAEFTLGKHHPQLLTYSQAVTLFLEDKARSCRPGTIHNYTRHLHAVAFKRLSDITNADVLRALKRINAPSEYNHRLDTLKFFFSWCRKRRYLIDEPTTGISKNHAPPRTRVLTDQELQSIWLACSLEPAPHEDAGGALFQDAAGKLPRAFAAIVKLLILTGQRRTEISSLQTSWIQNDTITIPASVAKNGREHSFPMGSLSKSILEPHMMQTTLSPYIFPARNLNSSQKPFNAWSYSKNLLDQLSGVHEWTLHDLRRGFATKMAELGIFPHIIERLLNHVSGSLSPISLVYNRAKYLEEMRAAVELYEKYLLEHVIKKG